MTARDVMEGVVATKDVILIRMEGFRNAIDAFLTDPGEIPLLKIRKEYLKRNQCPLQVGLGAGTKSWNNVSNPIMSPLTDTNPMVKDFHDRMQETLKGGSSYYNCNFCSICPVSILNKQRCGIDEYYAKARARMAFQQGLKKNHEKLDSRTKEVLDDHRSGCSDLMSVCLAGFIELSAVLTSILHGEECTNA